MGKLDPNGALAFFDLVWWHSDSGLLDDNPHLNDMSREPAAFARRAYRNLNFLFTLGATFRVFHLALFFLIVVLLVFEGFLSGSLLLKVLLGLLRLGCQTCLDIRKPATHLRQIWSLSKLNESRTRFQKLLLDTYSIIISLPIQ